MLKYNSVHVSISASSPLKVLKKSGHIVILHFFIFSMQLLDGKKVSREIYQQLEGRVAALNQKNIHLKLAIILVGNDPASLSYIKQKQQASEQIGVIAELIRLKPDDVTTESLIELIHKLNADVSVHGILVQLPLPSHVYLPLILRAIDPKKDVDGFTAYNLGKMFLSTEFEDLAPCTPLGVIRLLEYYHVPLQGKEVVMVGASNIVGKPMAIMFLNRGSTVTICHKFTVDLPSHTQKADILVVAVGKEKLITKEMVKKNAVVVDIGFNRTTEGKMVGDVDFNEVAPMTSYITPVPGGCGPMTVACLMENMIKAAVKQNPLFSS